MESKDDIIIERANEILENFACYDMSGYPHNSDTKEDLEIETQGLLHGIIFIAASFLQRAEWAGQERNELIKQLLSGIEGYKSKKSWLGRAKSGPVSSGG